MATKIKISYEAVDGFRQVRSFYTLTLAQKYAVERVGEYPEMGAGYAIAGDGVGKVMADGVALESLFPALERMRIENEADMAADAYHACRAVTVDEDGRDDYCGEDDLTERAIELRNDEYASRQTAIDAAYGM